MDIPTLHRYLDDPTTAEPWLRELGLTDVRRAHACLVSIATTGLTLDLLAVICEQFNIDLAGCADPDMALNNFDRFFRAARNPLSLGTLFERDPGALTILLQILATSQHFSDLLVVDPEGFDLLRQSEGRPVTRRVMVEELVTEVEALADDRAVMRALRQFKRRSTLRIAYGDIIQNHTLQTVTAQISFLADAVLEAATRAARRKVQTRRGVPIGPDGKPARFVVLAMGKLGGRELNYSSDIDLILLHEGDGRTDGRRSVSNREFFEQLARELVHYVAEMTELGVTYRVDLRLRPEGRRGPMVPSIQDALAYYDVRGRTWERQAYIKARPVAGDLDLGREFLAKLGPWIYRRYLSRADISGIKALKRRIEQRTHDEGADQHNVKTGHGGIRDVEFVIQFLQLLNGGDLPELRTGNTMEAIIRLEHVGCLSDQESTLLRGNYSFLRKIEHRLQIMFDLQTHVMPEHRGEIQKLALRMGYDKAPDRWALEAFEADYYEKTELNRKILDHLLHDAFGDDAATAAEGDLVLDPDPAEERIDDVLKKYAFKDVQRAYRNLMALAQEKIRFLSTRRCRHFLAAIAPRLLQEIGATVDPDATLVHLDKVSESLGGKGALWELFSFNTPSLRLCVELCAYSPYLCDILITNPGMIDGLMDSLVQDKLPSRELLRKLLAKLCRDAEDPDPILHSFKNDQQLRVGVRDLLRKEGVQTTIGTISDIAQTCIEQIAAREYGRLVEKFGRPLIGEGPRAGEACEMVILAMGKFGGREMNYHSDLDLVFLFEAEGHTAPESGRGERTSNQHFFSELGQRIIKTTSRLSAYGRLYEVDVRLRPTGKSGALAVSLATFSRYFAEGDGQLWERQALCKARVVHGSPRAAELAIDAVDRAALGRPWQSQHADEIRKMRRRLEKTAVAGDLKRGPGGIVDIEFLTQMLQLKHGPADPELRVPNTLLALEKLHERGHLERRDFERFTSHYRLLRAIEGRLQLASATARDKLPEDATELSKLAHLLRYTEGDALMSNFQNATRETRRRFDELFDAESV